MTIEHTHRSGEGQASASAILDRALAAPNGVRFTIRGADPFLARKEADNWLSRLRTTRTRARKLIQAAHGVELAAVRHPYDDLIFQSTPNEGDPLAYTIQISRVVLPDIEEF